MVCVEDEQFTRDYHDPDKRAITNGLRVKFNDGSKLKEVVVAYPIGQKQCRHEGMPILLEKFKHNLARCFSAERQQAILNLCLDQKQLAAMPVDEFVDKFVAEHTDEAGYV